MVCVRTMAARKAKLRHLDEFRRSVPHVSATTLAKILEGSSQCCPELTDRGSIREPRDMRVTEMTTYGPLAGTLHAVKKDGSPATLTFINPFAQLYVATKVCSGFANMLTARLHAAPIGVR